MPEKCMPGKLTVGLLQRRCSVDPQENLAATVVAIGDAADSLDPVEDGQDGTPIPVIPEVC